MAKFYEFTIAQGEAGNSLPAQNYVVTADRGFSRQVSFDILTAKFGDGYEQRVANGINNLEQDFSVGFQRRAKAEIDDIIAFFVNKNGVTPFNFTYPDSNNSGETTIKVICENFYIHSFLPRPTS